MEPTEKHVIIPESDEDESSQEIRSEEVINCSLPSNVTANLYSLSYQQGAESNPNFADDSAIPDDVLNEARQAISHLIPRKSESLYEKAYEKFNDYLQEKKIWIVNE